MTLPILYSFRRCPYAMRARLAILLAEQVVELREVLLRDKAPEFLATSPTATVPALRLPDGTVLDESYDIMVWALDQNDPLGLMPADPAARQAALKLAFDIEDDFKPHLDHYKYASRYPEIDASAAKAAAVEYLKGFEDRLSRGAFLIGDTQTVADIGTAPFVRQFAHVDLDWFSAQDWPNLIRWLDAFKASPAFRAIMPKIPRWHPGDPVTLFPSAKTGA